MRFQASLKELKAAIKDLEKAGKKAAKVTKKPTDQIDMFASTAPAIANDVDIDNLKNQLDEAITSVETLIKESA